MRRNVKTLLMGTVALMAGVGLASAQGMRDAPGAAGDRGASSGSSDQMTPGASGSKREMKGSAERGKSEKSEPRGQAQRGQSDKDTGKGQAKTESHERSTTGQGASDKDELKSKSSAKPAEKSTTGQATKEKAKESAKDKADSKSSVSKKDEKSTTGQASKDKTEKSTTGQGSSDTKASDTKASSDSKAQTPQNRQSQDPNAAKQNQTTGSSTQSNSTTEQSNASIRSQAGVQVSSQQRTTIQRSVLEARNVPRVDRVSFSIHTGTVVPRDVRIVSVTTFPALIEVFPRYRDYSFFVVEEEIVFVDRSHKIVDVVPVGGGARVGSSSTSTTVAVDLSEPEIREIQLVLIKRGYFHGRADGIWSPHHARSADHFPAQGRLRGERAHRYAHRHRPRIGRQGQGEVGEQHVVIEQPVVVNDQPKLKRRAEVGAERHDRSGAVLVAKRGSIGGAEKRGTGKGAVRAEGLEQHPADSGNSERPAEQRSRAAPPPVRAAARRARSPG